MLMTRHLVRTAFVLCLLSFMLSSPVALPEDVPNAKCVFDDCNGWIAPETNSCLDAANACATRNCSLCVATGANTHCVSEQEAICTIGVAAQTCAMRYDLNCAIFAIDNCTCPAVPPAGTPVAWACRMAICTNP